MAEQDMDHMDHLQAVADSDVEVLRKKEATYQGSWKRAGGRSAWFMARRNLDRLITMMAPPPKLEDTQVVTALGQTSMPVEAYNWMNKALSAEDIFAQIEADPSGADGTVLAVVRDARRYFTLVEAEMIARGVVKSEGVLQNLVEGSTGGGSGGPGGPNPSPPETHMLTLADITQYAPRTPEDGGQHAALYPWVYDSKPHHYYWYQKRSPTLWALNVFMSHGEVGVFPVHLWNLYDNFITGYRLKIELCPPDARDLFPSLPLERNFVELRDAPAWQRDLYREEETKHVLINRAWHNPAQD